jgi:hypothetical protein
VRVIEKLGLGRICDPKVEKIKRDGENDIIRHLIFYVIHLIFKIQYHMIG